MDHFIELQLHFIRLSVDSLLNEKNIIEFSIIDDNFKLQLYDLSELIDNYKQHKSINYLFSTNKVRLVFRYLKDSKTKLSSYPYVKCSYRAEARILNVEQARRSGELSLSQVTTKNRLEWVIMGPKDHFIVAKIIEFNSAASGSSGSNVNDNGNGGGNTGQLMFSLLSNR